VRFLLDTDTCVFWLRGHASLRSRMTHAIEEEDGAAPAISVITLAELRYGAACSARSGENHQAINDFASALTILPVGLEAARLFGDMKANLRREGMLIEDLDLLIATTARAYDLTLVTNNRGHFERIADLQLENWVEG